MVASYKERGYSRFAPKYGYGVKFLRRFALISLALLVLLAGLASLGLWRVQDARLSLEVARGLLERSLDKAAPGTTIDFTAGDIQWLRGEDRVELRFNDVVLKGGALATPVRAGLVELRLDASKLLAAKLRLRSIKAVGLTSDVDWGDSGGAGGVDYAKLRMAYETALQVLEGVEELRGFEALEISSSTLHLPKTNHAFVVDKARLDVLTQQLGLSAALRSERGSASVNLSADFQEGSANLALSTPRLDDLSLPFDGAQAVQMPVDVQITAQLGPTLEDDVAQILVRTGKGVFDSLDIYSGPRAFDGGKLEADIWPARNVVAIREATLNFVGATLGVEGEISGAFDKPNVALEGRLDGLDVAGLKQYWPPALGRGGHEWVVENIETGQLPGGRLRFHATSEMWDAGLPADALYFEFGVEGLSAHYTRPMPPLTDAYGRGVLTLDDLTLSIDKGDIAGVQVGTSTVVLGKFSRSPQWADIDLALVGPVVNILYVLDSEPLGYISAYGLDPQAASGAAVAQVRLRLPLLKDVLIEDVSIVGHVETQGLGLSDIDMTDGVAIFDVTGDGLSAKGDVSILGIKSQVEWREDFSGTLEDPTWVRITTRINDADLRRLGVETAPRFFGEVAVDLTAEGSGADIRDGEVRADLVTAELKEPVLGWTKPMGEGATYRSRFSYENDTLRLKDAVLQGAGLQAYFDAEFTNEDNAWLNASQISLGRSDFSLNATVVNKRWGVEIGGRSLDIAPLLTALYAPSEEGDEGPTPWPDFQGTIALQQLLLANDTSLMNMEGGISVYDDHITSLNLTGSLGGDAPFELHLLETQDNVRQLGMSAADAGLAAKALDLFDKGAGGSLNLTAEIRGRQDDTEIDGLATMSNFRLTEAPVLARILSVASLSGIADLARDGRIEFREVHVPFTLRRGVFDIDEASANGPALGLTLNGQFVQSLKEADLRGVIVPAYGFNSIIGRVPLLGSLITGGENEGVFAINYRISGDLTNPELNVNPASMLTPGILRKIFSVNKGQVDAPLSETDADAPQP